MEIAQASPQRVVDNHDDRESRVPVEESLPSDVRGVVQRYDEPVEDDSEGVQVKVLHVDAPLYPPLNDQFGVDARGPAQNGHEDGH
jgi:hypothetical protein